MFRDSSLLIYYPSSQSSPMLERRGYWTLCEQRCQRDDSRWLCFTVGIKYDTINKDLGDSTLREGLHNGPPGFEFIIFPSVYKSLEFSQRVCYCSENSKSQPHNVLLIIGFSFEHTVMFYTLEGSITVGQSIETSVFLWSWHMYHLSSLSKIGFFMHKKTCICFKLML